MTPAKKPTPPDPPATDEPATYQDMLDESLEETFPASDPIAPGPAAHPGGRVASDRNAKDWALEPGSAQPPAAAPGDDAAAAKKRRKPTGGTPR